VKGWKDFPSTANKEPPPPPRTVFSGHGGFFPENGTTVVPEGTSITFYSEHGSTITDPLGNAVETNQDVSQVFKRYYGPGDTVPNYTLMPPGDLKILGSPTTVTQDTNLSELLKPGMGNTHWAACTYNPDAIGANLRFTLIGIFDETLKQFITIYPTK
jgi:hypothetical protein